MYATGIGLLGRFSSQPYSFATRSSRYLPTPSLAPIPSLNASISALASCAGVPSVRLGRAWLRAVASGPLTGSSRTVCPGNRFARGRNMPLFDKK